MSATLQQVDGHLFILRVSGELKKSELDSAQAEFGRAIAAAGPARVLVLLDGFSGWEKGAAWDDMEFFFSHRDDIEKIAIVGEPRWEEQIMAFVGAGFRKGPVKLFAAESEARAWLAD